jgi:hypothetical protein
MSAAKKTKKSKKASRNRKRMKSRSDKAKLTTLKRAAQRSASELSQLYRAGGSQRSPNSRAIIRSGKLFSMPCGGALAG